MPAQVPHICSRLTRADADPGVIAGLLDEIAALSPDQQARELDDCISAIVQSTALSVAALAKWLTAKAHATVAKNLVHNLSITYLAADAPARFDLSVLPPSEAVLVGFRLCALATAPAVSLGWVIGLLRLSDEAAQRHALELMQRHIKEYPMTTQRLLEAVDTDTAAAFPAVAQAASILKQESDTLDEAPRLIEFALSREERIALEGLKLREQRAIHRHAEQSSVLLAFVKQTHFKYSHEAVIEITAQGQTFEQALSMQAHGLAIELPISERLDPQTSPLRRNRLWGGPAT